MGASRDEFVKYPRTPHLEGSRLQPGDSAADQTPLASLAGLNLAIEEKVDGANSGISFSDSAELRLQSRGHFLTGGAREKHFNQLKQWAQVHEDAVCLAFLEVQLDAATELMGEPKTVDVLRRTARKMSPEALAHAAGIPYSDRGRALLESALAPEPE